MSHINRFPSVLQGVEKGRRGQESGKTIGLRNSNIPVLAASKGLIQPKTTRLGVRHAKKESTFNVFLDENGTNELNVVKQLERLEPPRVPLSSINDVLEIKASGTRSPSPSIDEGSEYFSVPDSIPISAYDTPTEMILDMFEYMRARETEFLVRLRWDKQPELNDNMRTVLIDWLHDVSMEYNMESETLHLTASLIDRLLMMCSVSRPNVQLVGTAALMASGVYSQLTIIASKYEQIHPPELKDFVYVTDDSYTEHQILRMEAKMLNYLRFDISVPTVEWFVSHMLNMTKPSKKTVSLAHYLGDLTLLITSLNGIRPSVIASACIALSNIMTGPAAWSEEMEKNTGIPLNQLERPMNILLYAFNAASQSEQKSVYDKYSRAQYDEVALLDSPSVLPPFH
ncbi:cya-1 [Pristionchus pacificus]|uniref:Cya-1 n=1 Tax=Pristionchus pacificus TaxID=54126 RepID=A0A454Y7D3_PRIPA|nr:cya-1 [Pristionchus pacificus]|eukprot:PDM70189.1 cya-1 [Pristionchus pacificus]